MRRSPEGESERLAFLKCEADFAAFCEMSEARREAASEYPEGARSRKHGAETNALQDLASIFFISPLLDLICDKTRAKSFQVR